MKKQFFLAVMLCCTMGVNAQIKVNNNGKVIIGVDRTDDDLNNALSVSVFGKDAGTMRAGAKLAFGDFGRHPNYGWNVFIGEFGNTDTDKLWLHGKNGFFLTCTGQPEYRTTSVNNSGSYVVAYFNTSDNAFRFNVPVYTNKGSLVASDKRFKKNIKEIGNAMSSLKKLNGVSFDYLSDDNGKTDSKPAQLNSKRSAALPTKSENADVSNIASSDKEQRDAELMEQYEKLRAEADQNHLGLIAQEVQSVFPNLVKEDSAGYLYVDYIGLIPVIIEALKEQQLTIDAQSKKIKELENKKYFTDPRGNQKKAFSPNSDDETENLIEEDITTNAFLYQNTPNPFSSETEIRYFLPENAGNAVLYVFSLNGNLMFTKPLTQTGNGGITISNSELEAGMYVYTLAIDGVEVDSKRMILTEK